VFLFSPAAGLCPSLSFVSGLRLLRDSECLVEGDRERRSKREGLRGSGSVWSKRDRLRGASSDIFAEAEDISRDIECLERCDSLQKRHVISNFDRRPILRREQVRVVVN
jgi:hypothetical protein